MIITISDICKNQQKMLDNDNQIKLSTLIVTLGLAAPLSVRYTCYDRQTERLDCCTSA